MTNREYLKSLNNEDLARFLMCYSWVSNEDVSDKDLSWVDLTVIHAFEDWLKEEHKE